MKEFCEVSNDAKLPPEIGREGCSSQIGWPDSAGPAHKAKTVHSADMKNESNLFHAAVCCFMGVFFERMTRRSQEGTSRLSQSQLVPACNVTSSHVHTLAPSCCLADRTDSHRRLLLFPLPVSITSSVSAAFTVLRLNPRSSPADQTHIPPVKLQVVGLFPIFLGSQ